MHNHLWRDQIMHDQIWYEQILHNKTLHAKTLHDQILQLRVGQDTHCETQYLSMKTCKPSNHELSYTTDKKLDQSMIHRTFKKCTCNTVISW